MTSKNVTSAVAYYQAMNNKDLPSMEKYLHPEVHFITPFGTANGKDNILEQAKQFMTILDHLTVTTSASCETGNQVMLTHDISCKTPIGTLRTAALISFKDDLISRIELFFDPRSMLLKNHDPIIYKGMTEKQLVEAYDDYVAIPNLDDLLQKNREHAQIARGRLNPIENVSYGPEAIQKLDIYAPKVTDGKSKMPVIISIHGGGWIVGSKNPSSIPAEVLTSNGIILISIDYGLAPQYRMENMVSHVRLAIKWVYKNIAQYGGDIDRLYIHGVSAGAHLAATSIMPGWHQDFALPENIIKGLIAMSGIYDLCTLVHAPQTTEQKLLKMTLEESRLNSPLYHPPKISIPSILAYGEKEPAILYHMEANYYAQELQKANCDVSLIEVPGANHFDMINEIGNVEGKVFKAVMNMIFSEY